MRPFTSPRRGPSTGSDHCSFDLLYELYDNEENYTEDLYDPLGLTEDEKTALVEFMKALTDDRVRFHAAPFDHPELRIPHGHPGSTTSVTNDGSGRATDAK